MLLIMSVSVLTVFILLFLARSRGKAKDESSRLVVYDSQGRELGPNDIAGTGTVNWAVVGSEHVSRRAEELHELGRQAGAAGDHDRALHLFAQAHEEAPEWPYPVYDAAYTYLLKGDLVRAEREYESVERLAPRGFFTYKSELDCIRRERAGEFLPGTCLFYVGIADMPASAEKRAILERLLERMPSLAPAREKVAGLLEDDGAKLNAIDKGLSCKPEADTRGTLLINKALTIRRQGNSDEAVSILRQLPLDPQSTLGTELKAKFTLANLLARQIATLVSQAELACIIREKWCSDEFLSKPTTL
jgi:tetratricopeptide (TPR) repeat protein